LSVYPTVSVAMVVAAAAGSVDPSARSRWSAVVTWCWPSHSVRPPVWWHTATLGGSQWQWRLSLSTAVLLATAGTQYKQLQWTLAEQR